MNIKSKLYLMFQYFVCLCVRKMVMTHVNFLISAHLFPSVISKKLEELRFVNNYSEFFPFFAGSWCP